jgi:hypothetical protein
VAKAHLENHCFLVQSSSFHFVETVQNSGHSGLHQLEMVREYGIEDTNDSPYEEFFQNL